MWNKFLKELLFLKKGEQRALLVISLALFASLIFRAGVSRNSTREHVPDKEFLVHIDDLRKELKLLDQNRQQMAVTALSSSPIMEPSTFDPNKVSREALVVMGFPHRALANLIRYREAGGKFKKPEDLGKIYGLDSLSYAALIDFIVIEEVSVEPRYGAGRQAGLSSHGQRRKPGSDTQGSEGKWQISPKPVINMELNAADSIDLIRIKGIGPVYSSRIIRYRALLGGFYSLEQLWEIYGMDSLKFKFLSSSLYIDSSLIRRSDINEASFTSLVRHPYFTRQEVSDLIHYRNFAGEIKELTELKVNQVIDSTGYEKIKHYLKCRINKF